MSTIQAIRLIDTSILCEILRMPGKSSEAESKKFIAEFDRLAAKGVRFVLPLATLIETGNHIAQNGDGTVRRATATILVNFVRAAMADKSPFLKSKIWNADVGAWLKDFPNKAMRGVGFGDVSIQEDREIVKRTCGISELSVEIWSKDQHHVSGGA